MNSRLFEKTGQWWKVVVWFAAIVTGTGAMFWGHGHLEAPSADSYVLVTMLGVAIAGLGFAFACLAIRCHRVEHVGSGWE